MTRPTLISPTHPLLRTYYRELERYAGQHVEHESALRSAFQNLLADSGRLHGWTLIPEASSRSGDRLVRPDGTLRDRNSLPRGYWEAKDPHDDLDAEIVRKIDRGYPLSNIIFENTQNAVLYQNKDLARRAQLGNPRELADLLNQFYGFVEPDIRGFEEAVEEFRERVPDLARGLAQKIAEAHHSNRAFIDAFASFFELCQASLNPNIRREAVDEMLVQHLLTERLIRTIFNNPEFTRRNAIAVEVERVIAALVSESFSRDDYLKGLDPFYAAIEAAARTAPDFNEKQHFLNTVYESFFRGYSVDIADTHGIVYTPQPIVDFMCASVVEVLAADFGKRLGDPGVNILDPCTGTGNFIVNLLHRIPKRDLPRMYREQLFANEVMLLPYYIAALNIEHAYSEIAGHYEPFEGLCFVDTLDMAEAKQMSMFAEKNTERVNRQRRAPITVILGNPPYNVGQLNENDNNKNRKYPVIDKRVSETYSHDSRATNRKALSDPYVKFFRWAADRLDGRDGIVCFVSNNSFLEQIAFDGMRKHLASDFHRIYHLNLQGNVRKNPKLSGTAYNVFGIQVGVGITLAVRLNGLAERSIRYHAVPLDLRREKKLEWLAGQPDLASVPWQPLQPDGRHTWIAVPNEREFHKFLPIATSEVKRGVDPTTGTVFTLYSRGLETTRDAWVYGFEPDALADRVRRFIETYNGEVDRWRRAKDKRDSDSFVLSDETKIKWSSRLKETLRQGVYATFEQRSIRRSLYRPFTPRFVAFDPVLIHRLGRLPEIFPAPEAENRVIVLSDIGYRAQQFTALVADRVPDLHLCAAVDAHQCFPLYTYAPDGTNRRDNITDWALARFRDHYRNPSITKRDIFDYVYAILHHPDYCARFAENLKRELPRIPLAPDFAAFAQAGAQLARLHLDYEQLEPYPLEFVESLAHPLSYLVKDKMRLSKDKSTLIVNPSLTLAGIPPQAHEYRLGNRSALEWVVDQYQVSEDPRTGIRSDPNRPDDPQYIVRLVGQVVRVSLDTVALVRSLPPWQ
jgi:predicted helicase